MYTTLDNINKVYCHILSDYESARASDPVCLGRDSPAARADLLRNYLPCANRETSLMPKKCAVCYVGFASPFRANYDSPSRDRFIGTRFSVHALGGYGSPKIVYVCGSAAVMVRARSLYVSKIVELAIASAQSYLYCRPPRRSTIYLPALMPVLIDTKAASPEKLLLEPSEGSMLKAILITTRRRPDDARASPASSTSKRQR
ncbi:hypothetical protein EVAR_79358_1 [Eumeta japonica]|uniref:Uncharacterized protein n=1 Tax=Eumeta variegata TaxID=151549 RepID=A0A4C1THY1_EUMVA|nr:hypothetical protein EVAR_79358_1 [Eumeta japonica]